MPAACPTGRAFLISRLSPHLLHPKDHRGLCPHHPQTRPQTQPIEHTPPGDENAAPPPRPPPPPSPGDRGPRSPRCSTRELRGAPPPPAPRPARPRPPLGPSSGSRRAERGRRRRVSTVRGPRGSSPGDGGGERRLLPGEPRRAAGTGRAVRGAGPAGSAAVGCGWKVGESRASERCHPLIADSATPPTSANSDGGRKGSS